MKQKKMKEEEMIRLLMERVSRGKLVQSNSMLDTFAKEGDFLSKYISPRFGMVDAVDVNDHAETYKKNIKNPNTSFFIIDNREYIAKCDKTYDLILIDAPFCEIEGGTAEHFGMIDKIALLTREMGNTLLIFNTVLEPYDYDLEKNRNWKAIRSKFYGKENTSKMNWQFLTPFYISYFQKLGLNVLYFDRAARRSTQEGDCNSVDLNLVVVKRES
jgi:hypothetical protein